MYCLLDLKMRHLGQQVLVHDQIEYEGGTVWRRVFTSVSLIIKPFSDMKRFNSIDYGQFRIYLLRNGYKLTVS